MCISHGKSLKIVFVSGSLKSFKTLYIIAQKVIDIDLVEKVALIVDKNGFST